MEPVAEQALELCDEINRRLDEVTEELEARGVYEKAEPFFDDIREKVSGVHEWVEDNQIATGNQIEALQGWLAGINKWSRA